MACEIVKFNLIFHWNPRGGSPGNTTARRRTGSTPGWHFIRSSSTSSHRHHREYGEFSEFHLILSGVTPTFDVDRQLPVSILSIVFRYSLNYSFFFTFRIHPSSILLVHTFFTNPPKATIDSVLGWINLTKVTTSSVHIQFTFSHFHHLQKQEVRSRTIPFGSLPLSLSAMSIFHHA